MAITDSQQLEYISGLFYNPTTVSVKISILCLYRRIFDTPSFRLASLIVMIFCVLWAFGCGFAQAFICNTPGSFRDPTVKGYCYGYGMFFVLGLSMEMILDAVIVCLPVRMVFGMQLSRARKISVSLIFLLGGL